MNEKLVDFEKYCHTCKYRKVLETDDPCNECLTTPARFESHRPVNYVLDPDAAGAHKRGRFISRER